MRFGCESPAGRLKAELRTGAMLEQGVEPVDPGAAFHAKKDGPQGRGYRRPQFYYLALAGTGIRHPTQVVR
jgi:hypothetical protein